MDFLVGTFNTPQIFSFHFEPAALDPVSSKTIAATLSLTHTFPALGSHSWLALSPDKKRIYATAWTNPPSVAAYAISSDAASSGTSRVSLLNKKPVRAQTGYVWATETHLYSVGGPTGEAFRLDADGSIGELVQELGFVDDTGNMSVKRGQVAHGDFGGLRHGSHSVDVSPDGRWLWVADIGRNCVWTFAIQESGGPQHLTLVEKKMMPRPGDGPRHTWPHPNGKVLYVVQEHSSMVDVFEIMAGGADQGKLKHAQGVSIIPKEQNAKNFWADEVRISRPPTSGGGTVRYLYASTRGLDKQTRGYVSAFRLDQDGLIVGETGLEAVDIFATRTSGGIANAIEPMPIRAGDDAIEYLALTDSEEGSVSVLAFDGTSLSEADRVTVKADDGGVAAAATAVWL